MDDNARTYHCKMDKIEKKPFDGAKRRGAKCIEMSEFRDVIARIFTLACDYLEKIKKSKPSRQPDAWPFSRVMTRL